MNACYVDHPCSVIDPISPSCQRAYGTRLRGFRGQVSGSASKIKERIADMEDWRITAAVFKQSQVLLNLVSKRHAIRKLAKHSEHWLV
jgi:hypothetical protein